MANSGVEIDKEIFVTITKASGRYASGPIDRLKEAQGNDLTWNFDNQSGDKIEVKLQKFVGVTSPLDPSGAPTDTIENGKKGKIKIKAKERETDRFNYEIVVTNTANPAESNTIDPELQIDGKHGANALYLLGAAAAGAVAGAVATLALTQ